ncbi:MULTISPECIES: acetyl-CoA C-acetyltransferase [Gordonia]|uniref:Putative acetyl-CoA acyltransferase n=1 Tax=Gordonia alkanivorans NBRC 16433 TaxID=1027371 RepID=F9VPM2_9ACTN|nr:MULTISPECIES: acetyl-CoA C-acetyltransferase [Gordonia]MDH3015642.1 acetyl-CoA C-acetyltransferase [Gordonia alkanivorans]MDH3026658.1 acetyl-CoA C-acetyltransferase [Gordonia alkanivorans]MDH3040210.1 acetyl-CoA C-acetyltransferase [Gordonia alkanivorans]MDH3044619.1 acetyl-CoA C-acetyltransferase [Gordonia alkanivorans]MDH3048990.1 acetyl-CoA C-acetyltransferase [Gordonia alkanivorans]
MTEAWIIDGVRTPRGKGKPSGALHGVHPQELLGGLLRALTDRGLNADDVADVIMGNGEHAGDHANDVARSAVLTAGWPVSVPGVTINRFCGGGQQAVMAAATGVLAGWQNVAVAGGVESMSRHSYGQPLDANNPVLRERYPLVPQGISADLIATLEGFSRADVDAFAARSQELAATAIKENRFARSLVPVTDAAGTVLLDADEHVRPGTTAESLASLPASFARSGAKPRDDRSRSFDDMCREVYPEVGEIQHVHHAGNSSGVVDGAAAVVVASDDYAKAHGLTPRARIVTGAVLGAEPVIMLTAPGPASKQCLRQAGMSVGDIDLWEINEAFAAVPLKVIRDLAIDPDRVNVNGGAIALGHPIGATGAMLLQTVVDELERRDLTTGLVTMCTGGGMATATIVERI